MTIPFQQPMNLRNSDIGYVLQQRDLNNRIEGRSYLQDVCARQDRQRMRELERVPEIDLDPRDLNNSYEDSLSKIAIENTSEEDLYASIHEKIARSTYKKLCKDLGITLKMEEDLLNSD